jgi:predicted nucleotidyltransferase component of viral defense system
MIWEALRQKAAEYQLPLATVTAEVLHLAILDGLFRSTESQVATFQGGTSIHLLHGGYRFSEDLDFAGADLTRKAAEHLIVGAQTTIEKIVTQYLGVGRHEWKLPDPGKIKSVFAVWYVFHPHNERQKSRVKIEFDHFPVYQPIPLVVRSELDLAGRSPLVQGLPPGELLAEKLVAVAGRPFTKGRDLFDLWFFKEVLRTQPDIELIRKKINDYRVSFNRKKLLEKLQNYSNDLLVSELGRFLPLRFRRLLEKDSYRIVRASAEKLLIDACAAQES